MPSLNIINISLLTRIPHLYRGRGHAVAFAVSNDTLFLATSRNFVLRHDTSGGGVAELELTKSQDHVL